MLRHLWLLAAYILVIPAWPFAASELNDTHSLARHQCKHRPNSDQYDCDFNLPTLQEIIAHLRDKANGGLVDDKHSALFYTNLAYPNSVSGDRELGWIHSYNIAKGWEDKVYWLQSNVDYAWFKAQDKWITDHAKEFEEKYGKNPRPVDIFWTCYYQALAEAAIHPNAYIYTPKGIEWKKSSIWANVEFPRLTQNRNIERIYRVDPRPPENCDAPAGGPELLWDRSRGDKAMVPRWKCPV